MSKFRVFKRVNWKRNAAWPEGLEPHAKPMDRCRTSAWFDDENDARAFCARHNDARPVGDVARRLSPTYEYTSV